jgi:hypothetical protein
LFLYIDNGDYKGKIYYYTACLHQTWIKQVILASVFLIFAIVYR